MPLVRKSLAYTKFGEPELHSSKVAPIYVIWCTCGREPRGRRNDLGFIIEEYMCTYKGGSFGTARSATPSKRSTIVCLEPGCPGRWRVVYDPKKKPYIKPLLWDEYASMKEAEGLPRPVMGMLWSTIRAKVAKSQKSAQS